MGGDLEEMGDLNGGGEEGDVKLTGGDAAGCLAKRFDIFRQRPLVNRNSSDLRSAFPKSGKELRRGTAIFLHGDWRPLMGCEAATSSSRTRRTSRQVLGSGAMSEGRMPSSRRAETGLV